MVNLCQAYTPQTCWVIGNNVQTRNNEIWLTYHDMELYYVGGNACYKGIDKIPVADYPIVEKSYFIIPYNYNGVPYIVIQKKPIIP